ncbi:MAG: helix-turn-helix domain-containing protein [Thermoanaerobaculia bacterium]|nr:helix-turn-helix domain-containing protein [Thermoanaerobaculia bacterium]
MDTMDERLQTPEVARLTGLSVATIQKLRRTGQFPGWEEVSQNRKVIRRRLVDAWIEARTRRQPPQR